MDADKVRAILQNVLNGVSIITTKNDEIINGMTVAWASQITWEPPLIMISIGTGSYTNELISSSKVFAVNVLNEHQIDLAKHFGLKSGRDENKFKEIPYETKATGCPILKDIVAYLDCQLHSSVKVEDHVLLIGEILDAETLSTEKPLVYRFSDYW